MQNLCRAIFYPLSAIVILCQPGCVKESKPVASVNRSPLIIDEAMQQRQWSRTVVHFQNGETPAGPTGFILEHPANTPRLVPILTDGPLFLANVVFMPIDFAINPPWQRTIYQQGVVEPSFTGVPPLPPRR